MDVLKILKFVILYILLFQIVYNEKLFNPYLSGNIIYIILQNLGMLNDCIFL